MIEDLNIRLSNLIEFLKSPKHNLCLDTLLDALQSFFYEAQLESKRKKEYEEFTGKFKSAVEQICNIRVNLLDFLEVKLIGKGAFGKVSLVKDKRTQKIYAMKAMNKLQLMKKSETSFFMEEKEIMAMIDSPWIVKLHYSFIDELNVYMVMDFIQGGDLVALMSNYDLPESWIKFYIAETCIALNVLHNYGFIHRDVKPDNMLIGSDGHLKLCDFGTCIRVEDNNGVLCKHAIGTPDYLSPEMLMSQNKPQIISFSTDWWSVGIFLYELYYNEPPFYADSLLATYNKISNFEKNLKFPKNQVVSEKGINLISGILQKHTQRYGFEEIIKHEYFKDEPWNFESIRKTVPPFIPEIKGEADTSNFDDMSDDPAESSVQTKEVSINFTGSHLKFIGFSHNPELAKVFNTSTDVSGVSNYSHKIEQATEPNDLTESLKIINNKFLEKNEELEAMNNSMTLKLNEVNILLQKEIIKNEELNKGTDDYKENYNKMKEFSSKLEDKVQKLEINLGESKSKLFDTENFVTKLNNEKESLRTEICLLKLKLTSAKSQYDLTKENLISSKLSQLQINSRDNLSNSNNKSSTKSGISIDEYNELLKQNESLKLEFESKINQIETSEKYIQLKEELSTSESYLTLYQNQIKSLNERLNTVNNEIQKITKELEIEKKKSSSQVEEIRRFQAEISKLHESEKRLQQKFKLVDSDYKLKISHYQNQMDKLSANLKEKGDKLDKHEVLVNTLLTKVSELNYNIQIKDEEISNKEKEVKNNLEQFSGHWKRLLELEKAKKDQAILKLTQVLAGYSNGSVSASNLSELISGNNKANSTYARNENKLYKKLEMELREERNKYDILLSNFDILRKDYNDYISESQKLIENLRKENKEWREKSVCSLSQKNSKPNLSATSKSSFDKSGIFYEGIVFLQVDSKRKTRKLVWKKHFAILSFNGFMIITDEEDSDIKNKIYINIPLELIKNVRAINHTDLRKADSKDISKIFQIMFTGNIISKKAETRASINQAEIYSRRSSVSIKKDEPNKTVGISYLGHNFNEIAFNSLTICDNCKSGMTKEPRHFEMCYECSNCHYKTHTIHLKGHVVFEKCKINSDESNLSVVEMNFMANSSVDKTNWITQLVKSVSKKLALSPPRSSPRVGPLISNDSPLNHSRSYSSVLKPSENRK